MKKTHNTYDYKFYYENQVNSLLYPGKKLDIASEFKDSDNYDDDFSFPWKKYGNMPYFQPCF